SATQPICTTFYPFLGLADGLVHGRFGELDANLVTEYTLHHAPYQGFSEFPRATPADFHPWYTTDIGYAFLVQLARVLFPALPDNYFRSQALQAFIDFFATAGLFLLLRRWGQPVALTAVLLYALSPHVGYQTAVAFYYYWEYPLVLLVLAGVLGA